jgi:hypothetical protein
MIYFTSILWFPSDRQHIHYFKIKMSPRRTGQSSVHTWIKFCAKYLNNRSPIIEHVTEKQGEKQKLKTQIPQPRDFIYFEVLTSRTCLLCPLLVPH